MKPTFKLLLLVFLFQGLLTTSYGASYYISTSTGNDLRSSAEAQNPETPWKTINKLNSFFSNLKPGDVVYFRRGETYFGTIRLNASGTNSNPIRISAYGSGDKPIITSLVEVTGWRGIGNGRFESTNSFSANEVNIVVVDDEVQEKGRFPNAGDENGGYLTINSIGGSRSISSNELSSNPNFDGGEVVIRKVQWIIDRHPITSHSGGTITYSGSSRYSPSVNYGFFVQDHINTLDQFGEWFYNRSSKKLNMFFGSSDPSLRKVTLSTSDHLLTKDSRSSNILLENLHFKGSNKDAISISGGSGIKLSNNDIEFAGENGIFVTSIEELELTNNRVSYAMNNGIFLRFGNPAAKVINNVVENSFMFQGAIQSGDNNGVGIFAGSDDSVVENNRVFNTGYNGIHFNGNRTKIRNNLIDGYCLLKNDGGGIYSFGGQNGDTFTGREVEGNIILNGRASNSGTPVAHSRNPTKPHATGIFLDDNVSGVNVFNNTIAHTEYTGVKIANGRNITVNNNTFYDTDLHVLLGNSGNGGDTRNITVTNNVLFSKHPNQSSIAIRTTKNDISEFGIIDNNFFSRPLGDNHSISVMYFEDGNRKDEILNIQRWRERFNKDLNSKLFQETIKKFEIIKLIGSSQYSNGTFESTFSGISCSHCQLSLVGGKLTGNALQVVSPGYSAARVSVKSIKANQNYILSFKGVADKKGYLRAYLRHGGSPWAQISPSTAVEFGTSKGEYTVLLNSPVAVADAVVMLVSDEGNWTYWLDDLEFREADVNVTKPEEVFIFEYNASKSKKTIPLNGTYLDGRNRKFSSQVELEPYSSIVLARVDGKNDPIVNTPPTINLTSPKNNTTYEEGNNVTITAEASSENSTIDKVNFYIGDQLIGNTSTTPYSIQWKAIAGTYSIKAEAIDAFGLSKSTPETSISVKEKTQIQEDIVLAPKPDQLSPSPIYVDGSNNSISVNIGGSSQANYQDVTFIPLNQSTIKASSFNQSIRPESSDKEIYQTAGFASTMSFDVPLTNGTYTVITYHHEVFFGISGPAATSGQRVFDIELEGQVVKKDFDMYTEFGNRENFLKFEGISVSDGILNIKLNASANNAIISAIQIIPELPVSSTPKFSLFINAGSPSELSHEGNKFVSDYNPPYYSGSNTNENRVSSSIPLFQTHRFARSFTYSIPVPNGTYKVFTFHKENYFGTVIPDAEEGQRVFSISLEGKVVKKDFDMYVESNNRETTLLFENIIVTDGKLDLFLNATSNQAIISGIGIVSMESSPIERPSGISKFINTGSIETVAFDGFDYRSEFEGLYFSGSSNINEFSNASNEKLFQSHRFASNLSYKVPVPNGEYTVITLHNETFFGKQLSATGPGRRVFDIFIEGELKKASLDLFLESNNEPLQLSFPNISVTDGILNLDMLASVNNATISGIAIIPQDDVRFYNMSNLRQTFGSSNAEVMEAETDVSGKSIADIKIYPNPASSYAQIEIPVEIGGFTIQLINTSGQIVQSFQSENVKTSTGKYEIPVSQLKQGLYILSITTDKDILLRHKLLVNP